MPVRRAGKLNGLEAKLENAVKRGLILSGQLVAQRAQQKAPVDTGRLKRSITSIPQQMGRGTFKVLVGTNVIYALFQELGTKFMKAQPYLRPALKESAEDIKQLIIKNILSVFR